MTFDLNKHTARLLMDEPFFAALSRRIDKRSSTAIPTAGVKVDKDSGHFVMIYNPEFFEDSKVPMSEMVTDLVTAYKYGLKQLYYFNTYDGAGDNSSEEDCESCKI